MISCSASGYSSFLDGSVIFSLISIGWSFFNEPDMTSIRQLIDSMKQRIEIEENHRILNATEYERNEKHLERFLRLHFLDIEVSLNRWNGWVSWRHGNCNSVSFIFSFF
jgi:hypothetical protein